MSALAAMVSLDRMMVGCIVTALALLTFWWAGAHRLSHISLPQSMLTNSTKVKAAWSILVGPKQTNGLQRTLRSLYDNVLIYNPRPVLLFYVRRPTCRARSVSSTVPRLRLLLPPIV